MRILPLNHQCLVEPIIPLTKAFWLNIYDGKKIRGRKGHTNHPAVSAKPWPGTPSWDDDIIPSEWSASNLVKGLDCFFFLFVFLFFCPSATCLFPSHLSLFSIFCLLRSFLHIKEEIVRGIHTGRYWKEEELHFSFFLFSHRSLSRQVYNFERTWRRGPALSSASTGNQHDCSSFFRTWSSSLKTAQRREPLAEFTRSLFYLRSRTMRYFHGL